MNEKAFNVGIINGYILVEFSQETVLTYDLIIEAFDQKCALPEYQTMHSIWDLRNCKPHKTLNYKTMMDMVNYMKQNHRTDCGLKKASIIVDSRLVYGMLRMFQILGEDLPFIVKVFQKEEEAVSWVETD